MDGRLHRRSCLLRSKSIQPQSEFDDPRLPEESQKSSRQLYIQNVKLDRKRRRTRRGRVFLRRRDSNES